MNRPKWFDEVWDGGDDQPSGQAPNPIFDHPNGTVWRVGLHVQVIHPVEKRRIDFIRDHFLIVPSGGGTELWTRMRLGGPIKTEEQASLEGMKQAIAMCVKGVRGRHVTEEELNEMAT